MQKELPGFISGRLQMVVLKEALWLVQNGFASPQDVDFVLKSSLGRRWSVAGVFEVLEIAGWDLISEVASEIAPISTRRSIHSGCWMRRSSKVNWELRRARFLRLDSGICRGHTQQNRPCASGDREVVPVVLMES